MRRTSIAGRLGTAVLGVLATAAVCWASSATFAITGQGITLGEAKEGDGDGKPAQITAKAEVGKPFTLVAQGMVLPRGGKAQPGEPDAGEWTFDAKQFKQLPPAGTAADKTKVVIRLEPTAAGRSRVRFAGKVLGYDRAFDVLVEVAAPARD